MASISTAALAVTPVNAKFTFDPDNGTFRLRVNTQIKRADGTRYEIEIEQSANIAALMTILLQIWSGLSVGAEAVTMMQEPGTVNVPNRNPDFWGATADLGDVHDVGDADRADDLDDSTMVPVP